MEKWQFTLEYLGFNYGWDFYTESLGSRTLMLLNVKIVVELAKLVETQ